MDVSAAGETVGVVRALWRYPVKSMLGERCAALDLDSRGVAGDRLYAVRDAAGKFGSGKNTRRFCRIDGLLGFAARSVAAGPAVVFPDGRLFAAGDPALDAALSAALGQPLSLAREVAVSHLDAGPVHLLTTAALAWLADRLPGSAIDERRFRPNLVIEAAGAAPIEHGWVGCVLAVGAARLQVTGLAERCLMVDLPQGALPRDGGILRELAGAALPGEPPAPFGVYARVLAPGPVLAGDAVQQLG
ncbi:MAG TPA: MOSC domain-containing protein [Herpetosiphonaceae bacterium]